MNKSKVTIWFLIMCFCAICLSSGSAVSSKNKEIEKAFLDHISSNPVDKETKFNLVDLYINTGQFDKAFIYLKSFAAIQEKSDRPFKMFLKLATKKYEAAKTPYNFELKAKVYKIRISIYPSDQKIYRKLSYELGKLYFEQGNLGEAFIHLDTALIKMKPKEESRYPEIKEMYEKCKDDRYKLYKFDPTILIFPVGFIILIALGLISFRKKTTHGSSQKKND